MGEICVSEIGEALIDAAVLLLMIFAGCALA
jgi:hypothetical protein